jgi:hypothetical protein
MKGGYREFHAIWSAEKQSQLYRSAFCVRRTAKRKKAKMSINLSLFGFIHGSFEKQSQFTPKGVEWM